MIRTHLKRNTKNRKARRVHLEPPKVSYRKTERRKAAELTAQNVNQECMKHSNAFNLIELSDYDPLWDITRRNQLTLIV